MAQRENDEFLRTGTGGFVACFSIILKADHVQGDTTDKLRESQVKLHAGQFRWLRLHYWMSTKLEVVPLVLNFLSAVPLDFALKCDDIYSIPNKEMEYAGIPDEAVRPHTNATSIRTDDDKSEESEEEEEMSTSSESLHAGGNTAVRQILVKFWSFRYC